MCEANPARLTLEQRFTEGDFETGNSMADGRGRNTQRFCSVGKAAQLSRLIEVN